MGYSNRQAIFYLPWTALLLLWRFFRQEVERVGWLNFSAEALESWCPCRRERRLAQVWSGHIRKLFLPRPNIRLHRYQDFSDRFCMCLLPNFSDRHCPGRHPAGWQSEISLFYLL